MIESMSDIALYRKYRPEDWDQVLGQEHIVKVLRGALELGNVAHAYLFFGSRGTGKTTVARIVARELGVSANDTFEIDAASNRGIDDIRELRETIATLPFDSKYKVYIFDEVHMLSKDAWNALLKTLEEPPAHVIFILATTEIEKVPETIVSRCQVFTFKKPNGAVLREMITGVAKNEGAQIDAAGVELIALLGDGSFRDTHGILQKVLSFSKDKRISMAEIEAVTNAPSSALAFDMVRAIALGDTASGVKLIGQAAEANVDMALLIKLVAMKLRVALLVRYAPEMKDELLSSLAEHERDTLLDILKAKGSAISSKTLEILLEAGEMMKHAAVPTLPLELALIRMAEK